MSLTAIHPQSQVNLDDLGVEHPNTDGDDDDSDTSDQVDDDSDPTVQTDELIDQAFVFRGEEEIFEIGSSDTSFFLDDILPNVRQDAENVRPINVVELRGITRSKNDLNTASDELLGILGIDKTSFERDVGSLLTKYYSFYSKDNYSEVISKFKSLELDKIRGHPSDDLSQVLIEKLLAYNIRLEDFTSQSLIGLNNDQFKTFLKLVNRYSVIGLVLLILGGISIITYLDTITRLIANQYRITRNVSRISVNPNGIVVQLNLIERLTEKLFAEKVQKDVDEIINDSFIGTRLKRAFITYRKRKN